MALFSLFFLSLSVNAQNNYTLNRNQLILPKPIIFHEHANDIADVNDMMLDYVADFLKDNPNITKLRIESHVFSENNSSENMKLSMQRAAIVAYYLTVRGIDCSLLTVSGFGDTMPLEFADIGVADADIDFNTRLEFYIERLGMSETASTRNFKICKFYNPCEE